MAEGYRYDPVRRRYITPDGKVVRLDTIRALRDRWATIQGDVARDMAARVTSGSWSLAEFEVAFRAWIGETIGGGYQLGKGGAGMMSADDAFALARMISDQANYVVQLSTRYGQQQISDNMFAALVEKQAGSAVNAFEQGQGSGAGIDLPAYPADGSTECGMYCRCYWSIEEFDDHWAATWVTVGDERVCPTCEGRGEAFDPFIAYK